MLNGSARLFNGSRTLFTVRPSAFSRIGESTERFQLVPKDSQLSCEISMSKKIRHVKVRCVECKAKFDSKYDAFDTSAIMNVGQELQNFIFCQRCGKRVSVVVFDIR